MNCHQKRGEQIKDQKEIQKGGREEGKRERKKEGKKEKEGEGKSNGRRKKYLGINLTKHEKDPYAEYCNTNEGNQTRSK